jgi:hypothetical protein
LVGKGLLQSQLLSVGWFLVLSNKPYFWFFPTTSVIFRQGLSLGSSHL